MPKTNNAATRRAMAKLRKDNEEHKLDLSILKDSKPVKGRLRPPLVKLDMKSLEAAQADAKKKAAKKKAAKKKTKTSPSMHGRNVKANAKKKVSLKIKDPPLDSLKPSGQPRKKRVLEERKIKIKRKKKGLRPGTSNPY